MPTLCTDGITEEDEAELAAYFREMGETYTPDRAEVDAEYKEQPQMMQHADMWDNFIELWRQLSPFKQDDDEYRQQRAVRLLQC